ncbi:RNaseH domain-containing protein [Streptomyces sp. SCSIO 30461]|uniref:RNaseH domain-containing protein n=1 Tax=Streptomyces sp. SCSIO 30461 TaxID=3118085 RepID=UPI0030D4BAFB
MAHRHPRPPPRPAPHARQAPHHRTGTDHRNPHCHAPHRRKGRPWQVWAYSPQAGQWQPHSPATTALHAADLAWDVSGYRAAADETLQARAAGDIVDQALIATRTQLPTAAPAVLYVDGDVAEYIWAGLTDEALGQDPPPGTPRPASWLPGHSLPRAQRPLASARVIGDLERIRLGLSGLPGTVPEAPAGWIMTSWEPGQRPRRCPVCPARPEPPPVRKASPA